MDENAGWGSDELELVRFGDPNRSRTLGRATGMAIPKLKRLGLATLIATSLAGTTITGALIASSSSSRQVPVTPKTPYQENASQETSPQENYATVNAAQTVNELSSVLGEAINSVNRIGETAPQGANVILDTHQPSAQQNQIVQAPVVEVQPVQVKQPDTVQPVVQQYIAPREQDLTANRDAYNIAKFVSTIPNDLVSGKLVRVNDKLFRLENAVEAPYFPDGLLDTPEEIQGIIKSVSICFNPSDNDLRFANPQAFEQTLTKLGLAGIIGTYEQPSAQVTPADLAVQLNKVIKDSPNRIVRYTNKDGNEYIIGPARAIQKLLEEQR